MTKLSVIIPCYNCERTLEEAVASVYRQEPPIAFDVTMVDDGSADGTWKLMQRLQASYPRVKLVRHEANLGGGAARNTAVANSTGDIIFCLDSDDMMGPDFLRNLVGFWLEKRCDGVGISKSIKFKGTDVSDIAYVTEFEGAGQPVRFGSLFDSSACSLFSTFLITRHAFDQVGGYPTNHGFDTQGMAFRFLCSGLTAYTCPDSIYYHRVQHSQSYFLREASAGKVHWNWFKIFEEFLYLFRDRIQALILDYDYFRPGPRPTIDCVLRDLEGKEQIWAPRFEELRLLGRDRAAEVLAQSNDKYDQYWLGVYWQSKAALDRALGHFHRALTLGFNHRIIYVDILGTAMGLSADGVAASLTLGDVMYHVNDPKRIGQAMMPPLTLYQRFENSLLGFRALAPLGGLLRAARGVLRRLRGRGSPGA